MRGGVLGGNDQVVAGTSKRYTGRPVPAGSSRLPVTLTLVGFPGATGDWMETCHEPSGWRRSDGSRVPTSSSEPPTDCTVSSPLRDHTSLATVRSAGRPSGVTTT